MKHFIAPPQTTEADPEAEIEIYVPLLPRSTTTMLSAHLTEKGMAHYNTSLDDLAAKLPRLREETGKFVCLYRTENSDDLVIWGYLSGAENASDLWQDAQDFAHALEKHLGCKVSTRIDQEMHKRYQLHNLRSL